MHEKEREWSHRIEVRNLGDIPMLFHVGGSLSSDGIDQIEIAVGMDIPIVGVPAPAGEFQSAPRRCRTSLGSAAKQRRAEP